LGRREFATEVSWDLPSLAAGATALLDVTVTGARVGDLAQASLATSSRSFELDATSWSDNTVRVLARNVDNHRPRGSDAVTAGDKAKGALRGQPARETRCCTSAASCRGSKGFT
jgi:hypothetical protein